MTIITVGELMKRLSEFPSDSRAGIFQDALIVESSRDRMTYEVFINLDYDEPDFHGTRGQQ